MTEKIGAWLMSVSAASLCSALIEFLTPSFRDGMEKYVKFTCAAAVLAIVAMPISGIVSEIEKNIEEFGIICQENNINVTENTEADKWILKGTVEQLEKGIKKLVYDRFSLMVTAEVSAQVTQNGIEVDFVTLSAPAGTAEGRMYEIKSFVGEYLGVNVIIKKAGEG